MSLLRTTGAIGRFKSLLTTDNYWAVGGWTFFVAENVILSENRTWIIKDICNGDDNMYHTIYGVCSTIATISIGYAYYKLNRIAKASSVVLPITSIQSNIAFVTTSLGVIMASQALPKLQIPVMLVSSSSQSTSITEDSVVEASNATTDISSNNTNNMKSGGGWTFQVRCPFDFTDRKHNSNDNPNEIKGMERITRHPGLWSLAFVGIGNAILQPTMAMSLWMLGPTAVALVGGNHNDSRFRRGIGGTLDPMYESLTSNVPFIAIVSGKQGNPIESIKSLFLQETKLLNAAVAIAAVQLWIMSKGRTRIGSIKTITPTR